MSTGTRAVRQEGSGNRPDGNVHHPNDSANREIDPRTFLGVVRKRGWIVVLLVIVCAGGAYAASTRQPRMYRSTSSVRISNPSSENVFQNVGLSPVDPRRQVETETRILQSNDLRELVEQQLGEGSGDIIQVQVTNPINTDLLDIAVSSRSADLARRAADAYADVYVRQRKNLASSELDRRATELRAEVDRLSERIHTIDEQIASRTGPGSDSLRLQKAALENQLSSASTLAFQLGAQAALYNGAVAVTERAVIEPNPVSPRPTRNAAIAGLLALLLGGALVTMLDRLDDRITTADDLTTDWPDVSVLATLPRHTAKRSLRRRRMSPDGPRAIVPSSSAAAEAFRILRGNVRYALMADGHKMLMVTSPSGSEGKTVVTANLAVALAENGHRVIVVSADLRRPALAAMFGVDENRTGITSILLDNARLEDALVTVTIGDRRVEVLPAGRVPSNPGELLGSRMMADLLDRLRRSDADFVLIDSPPVLPVSDSLAIAQHVDGVVVLASAGRTRAHQLAEACDRLRKVGADILGFVLNGDPRSIRRYGSYGYQRSDQPAADKAPRQPRPLEAPEPIGRPALTGDNRDEAHHDLPFDVDTAGRT